MAGVDFGDEDLTLVLPDVDLRTVQNFLELFYTGTTSLAAKSDLQELQNFVQNQIQFSGQLDLNSVDYDHSYYGPRTERRARNASGKEISQKAFQGNVSAQETPISAVSISKTLFTLKNSIQSGTKLSPDSDPEGSNADPFSSECPTSEQVVLAQNHSKTIQPSTSSREPPAKEREPVNRKSGFFYSLGMI